jgi:hypothetical protein
MDSPTSRAQLNVRISPQVAKLIDKKRIELSKQMGGTIPSRSDVLRLALGAYLGVDVSEWEADGRKSRK